MPCYHPLLAVENGVNENGKTVYKILPTGTDPRPYERSGFETAKVPCGQCIGCRIDYARSWAARLMLELRQHDLDKCFFVTLTYDDEHIGHLRNEKDYFSLSKRDLQLFLKRLRKAISPEKCRFYAVGEYGSTTLRPHFHLILFNCSLNDYGFEDIHRSQLGYMYRSSNLLQKVWPYGFNVCAPVTFESCSYCARYMMKKLKGVEGGWYDLAKIERPFSTCSRKPGIGAAAFDDMEDFASAAFIPVETGHGVKQFPVPSYFEKLYRKVNEEDAEFRAALHRAIGKERRKAELKATSLSEEEYLAVKELEFKKKLKILDENRNKI